MSIDMQTPLQTGLGFKPEPADILTDCDLTGKRVVITGGYSGIGLETTRALAAIGADVIVPVRTREKADAALRDVPGNIQTATMDLADGHSISRFADALVSDGQAISLLINNAGIMACPETRIGPGWEAQFGVNHMGHFALTNALLPLLKKANGARVVSLSSVAHRRNGVLWDDIHFEKTPYDKWVAYAQSKSANALFAVGLDARGKSDGVRAYSVHPGGILTPLQRHLQKEEMIALGWIDESGEIPEAAQAFFKTPAQGCATTLWCATSPLLNDTGGVYCEDCNVAARAQDDSPRYTCVAPWAADQAGADQLWAISETMLASA